MINIELIIILFSICSIIGSLMWIRPSPQQQAISKLRLHAMQLGLKITLHTFHPDKKTTGIRHSVTGTCYRLNKPSAFKNSSSFRLIRQPGWLSEQLTHKDWHWHDFTTLKNIIKLNELIGSLTNEIDYLESTPKQVCLICKDSKTTDANTLYNILIVLRSII